MDSKPTIIVYGDEPIGTSKRHLSEPKPVRWRSFSHSMLGFVRDQSWVCQKTNSTSLVGLDRWEACCVRASG